MDQECLKNSQNFKGEILKMSKLFGEVFPQMCGKQAHGKTNIVLVAYGGVSKQPDRGKADRTTTRYKMPRLQS